MKNELIRSLNSMNLVVFLQNCSITMSQVNWACLTSSFILILAWLECFLFVLLYSSSSDFAFFSSVDIEGCLPAMVPSLATTNILSVSLEISYSRLSFIWVAFSFGQELELIKFEKIRADFFYS